MVVRKGLNWPILVRIKREVRIVKLAVRRGKVQFSLLELGPKRDFQIIIKLLQKVMVHQVLGQKDWLH
jgi:hypothetical protein